MGGLNSKRSWAGKSFTHFAATVGISSLKTDEQGRQSVEICLGALSRAGAGASIPDSPAGGSQHVWDGVGSSGVLCCPPGGTSIARQVRHFSILRNFSIQKLQQN